MSNEIRRYSISIVEKAVKIIQRLDSGLSNKDVCQELGIGRPTMSIVWRMNKYLIERENKIQPTSRSGTGNGMVQRLTILKHFKTPRNSV